MADCAVHRAAQSAIPLAYSKYLPPDELRPNSECGTIALRTVRVTNIHAIRNNTHSTRSYRDYYWQF